MTTEYTPTTTEVDEYFAIRTAEVFEAGASWLAEYLLSDENVEKAARAIHEVVEAGTPWEDTTAIQRTDRRVEARAALQAVLGKDAS